MCLEILSSSDSSDDETDLLTKIKIAPRVRNFVTDVVDHFNNEQVIYSMLLILYTYIRKNELTLLLKRPYFLFNYIVHYCFSFGNTLE